MNTVENKNASDLSEDSQINKEIEVENYLSKLSIPFEVHSHEALFTMEKCEQREKDWNIHIPKNLFLANRQQTQFYLLLMPGNKVFKTKEISSQINSARLSFGNEDSLYDLLGVRKGSCTPLGLYFDKEKRVQFLIDEDILSYPRIGIHPMTNTKTLILKTDDLLNVFLKDIGHSYKSVRLIGE